MKKHLSIIIGLCVLLLLSGCSETKENNLSKNNSVQMESKIEPNQDMQVQTSSIDNVDIDIETEIDSKCLICDNTTWQGSVYCSMHKCSRSGCDYKRVKNKRYCQYHKCGKSDCGNQNSIDSSQGSAFCSQHTCHEFGCVNQVTSGGYCVDHANN